MSIFEFRQWIESIFPWWVPFVVPCVAMVLVVWIEDWLSKTKK